MQTTPRTPPTQTIAGVFSQHTRRKNENHPTLYAIGMCEKCNPTPLIHLKMYLSPGSTIGLKNQQLFDSLLQALNLMEYFPYFPEVYDTEPWTHQCLLLLGYGLKLP